MKLGTRHLKEQNGAGLIETLLAIAIVGAIMPFAYNGMVEMTDSIANARQAAIIAGWDDPVMAWVRKNQADWPSSAQVEFDAEELTLINPESVASGDKSLVPYAGFIDKRPGRGSVKIDAYLAFRPYSIKKIRVHNITSLIGSDAAIVDENGDANSPAGWGISADIFADGDIIYRISDILGEDEAYKYLHRTYLDDADMNTMWRDLSMGKNDISDVGTLWAQTLNASSGEVWFAETPEVRTTEVFFPEGATIDASKAELSNVNVSGDIAGFRKITAARLKGIGVLAGSVWSGRGHIIADGASIAEEIHIQRDLNVKSDTAQTISGFAGINANSLATSYLSADRLIFADGFGMTISSELMYSTSLSPIRLGGWGFPSDTGPSFSSLVLTKAGAGDLSEKLTPTNPDEFAPITMSGWKDR
jgi:type II secretory pathway pseudopilin PulG